LPKASNLPLAPTTARSWVRTGLTSMSLGKIALATPYWKLVMLLAAQAATMDAGRKGLLHWMVRLAFLAAPGLGVNSESTLP
jgi:hypothetical protein